MNKATIKHLVSEFLKGFVIGYTTTLAFLATASVAVNALGYGLNAITRAKRSFA